MRTGRLPPNMPGGKEVCDLELRLCFESEADIGPWMYRNCPGYHPKKVWLCGHCGGYHYKSDAPEARSAQAGGAGGSSAGAAKPKAKRAPQGRGAQEEKRLL